MCRPSDFPCNVQAVACGGYGGNHQIHHPPLVVKGYAVPCVEVAGNLIDLFLSNCPQQTSFSVHFLFSAACELWRRSRGSIFPGWIWGQTRRRRPYSVSSPYPGKSPLPASRQAARPPTETIYSRSRKKSSAGRCRCPHRQGQCSCRPHSYSTPAVSRHWPVSFALVSCGRVCRPACAPAAADVYMDFLSCVPPSVLRCRSLRKGFLPSSSQAAYSSFRRKRQNSLAPLLLLSPQSHTALRGPRQWRRVPALARSPQLRVIVARSHLWTLCPEVGSLRASPTGYSFSDGHSVFKVLSIDELI